MFSGKPFATDLVHDPSVLGLFEEVFSNYFYLSREACFDIFWFSVLTSNVTDCTFIKHHQLKRRTSLGFCLYFSYMRSCLLVECVNSLPLPYPFLSLLEKIVACNM